MRPTATVPKLSDVVDSVTGAFPVPERSAVCGLVGPSSVNVRVPVVVPAAVGEKVTPTVQLVPAATLPVHVSLDFAKPALAATPDTFSATLWRFFKVTVLTALVLPTATVPKLMLLGVSEMAAMPVPVSPTVWVATLSVILTVPDTGPTAVGANVTWMVHDAPDATLPQSFVCANGPWRRRP